MNSNRRSFLKMATAGTGGLLLSNLAGYASVGALDEAVQENQQKSKSHKQLFNMCNFAAPAIPVVRIGYVGIGGRGSGAVSRMTNIKNVEIKALCDIREAAVKANQETLKSKGLPAAAEYFGSETAFKKMCERNDIDLIS